MCYYIVYGMFELPLKVNSHKSALVMPIYNRFNLQLKRSSGSHELRWQQCVVTAEPLHTLIDALSIIQPVSR